MLTNLSQCHSHTKPPDNSDALKVTRASGVGQEDTRFTAKFSPFGDI